MTRILGFIAALSLVMGGAQAAIISIGGIDHDDTAFVDNVTLDSGSFGFRNAPSAGAAMTGGDVNSVAGCVTNTGTCGFTASFTDNVAVNGAGDDIILYGIGTGVELFDITINGITLFNQQATATGTQVTQLLGGVPTLFDLVAYSLNLDLFNVAAGATISSFFILSGVNGSNPEDFIAFAALNNSVVTPLPGALPLMLSGLFSGWLVRRRNRKAA